jgi:hypothetical protein
MKKLIVLLMLAATAYGQTPTYTPMRSFYEYKGIKMDSLFLLPVFADTNAANLARTKTIDKSVIMAGTISYVRDVSQNKWVKLGEVNTNFANADLTATGDRYHNFDQRNLNIDNTYRFSIIGNDYDRGFASYIGTSQYDDNFLRVRAQEITPTGEFAELRLEGQDSYNLECSTAIYGASKISGRGKDINVNTDSLGSVKFQYGVTNHYTFPKSSPDSGSAMAWVSDNQLGWVDITPGYNSSVDLSVSNYACPKWGVYTITVTSSIYTFDFPDPREYDGKYLIINNNSGGDVGFSGYLPYDRGTGSTISNMGQNKMLSLFSDGNDWRGHEK